MITTMLCILHSPFLSPFGAPSQTLKGYYCNEPDRLRREGRLGAISPQALQLLPASHWDRHEGAQDVQDVYVHISIIYDTLIPDFKIPPSIELSFLSLSFNHGRNHATSVSAA